jgi:hypothetical protein
LRENISKIQYLSAAGTKIYKVTNIDFINLTIEATETGLINADIPENELFPIEELGEFRVRLCNDGRMGAIVDFVEWIKRKRKW